MFKNIPVVTKHLLVINILAYLATIVLKQQQIDLEYIGGLNYFMAPDFHLYQFITYQFLHGSFSHLFFNMFALWMFGCVIENVWGPKKFIFYYIFCGIGAGLCQELVQFITYGALPFNSITIGASGAVYAILLAFGMTFPEERIFIFPLPVPIKAKWFVCIYAVIELTMAMSSYGDGVAHMAHLGGMLFGFLLITYWRKHPGSDYNFAKGFKSFSRFTRQSGATHFNRRTTTTTPPPPHEDDMAYNARKKARQEEIDKILDKIRKSGYDSLTKDEKQRLFDASRDR